MDRPTGHHDLADECGQNRRVVRKKHPSPAAWRDVEARGDASRSHSARWRAGSLLRDLVLTHEVLVGWTVASDEQVSGST